MSEKCSKPAIVAGWFRVLVVWCSLAIAAAAQPEPLAPLLASDHPVTWWFVFKLNAKVFPGCGTGATRTCPFGGAAQSYPHGFSQQFVYASNEHPTLQQGTGCAGATTTDPLGSTFDQIYRHARYYVVWNDQFYDDPAIAGCSGSCAAPWGHSKGMVAWNDAGEGVVLQVSTPSWPAAGSKDVPRQSDGNTLGCVKDDNVLVSQQFFALKLSGTDLTMLLAALTNASVVTDPHNPQIVKNGGPADVQEQVARLGARSTSTTATAVTLSSGVQLISKPSQLNVPPWQLVSALLGGKSLRAATWWAAPKIPATTARTKIGCWDQSLGKPGSVAIAKSGHWAGKTFGLTGGVGPNFNHAKIGVSTTGAHHYAIFGDMNQQGAITGNCGSSQDGRGGLFYVVEDAELSSSVGKLIGVATRKRAAQ